MMLKRSDERGHPCLVLNLSGKSSNFSPLSMILAVGFCRYSLTSWGSFLLFLAYWVFIMNGCWVLSNAFSASVDMIVWFFFFSLLIWWITLIDFWMLNQPCIPGINTTWSWCIILFIYCLIQFTNFFFFEDLGIHIHERYWSVVFFSCNVFVSFGMRVIPAS